MTIGTGTAAATFSPYALERSVLGLRGNTTSPIHSSMLLGGYSSGSAELTAPEIAQLFADYKATGNIPTVPGKTGGIYDVKVAAGGGASYPATITDTIGGANMTVYTGSAANLTYTTYSNPTVAW